MGMKRPFMAFLAFLMTVAMVEFLLLSGGYEGLSKVFGFDIGLDYPGRCIHIQHRFFKILVQNYSQ